MQASPPRDKKTVRLWRGALAWFIAILAWQTFQYFSNPRQPQMAVQEHSAGRQLRGSEVVATCAACHAFSGGENRIGPPLQDLFGRRAGTAAGFAYSQAMRDSNIVWNQDTLRKFLLDPAGTVPGTAMAIGGVSPDDAQAIIDFLEDNK